MAEDYFKAAKETRERLNQISPTMCMAKWLQVSMHLPQGLTQSCYHPPTHKVPLDELAVTPRALHNTHEKVRQRKKMWEGERPSGCQYCWNIEDAPDGPHLSDRHYRSSEWWAQEAWDEVVSGAWDENLNPRYVEVNFNQACNFKCTYCSPHLSTAWEQEQKEFGPIKLSNGRTHNEIASLRRKGWMPIEGAAKNNPYIDAFWKWWPDLYKDLRVFRMTGGEPLMDKNTFKVLDYVNEHPNTDIELSITSNMCPPDPKLFDKFVNTIKEIERVRVWEDPDKVNKDTGNNWFVAPACKHFSLFVSLDSVGEQAEYIRTGLDYETLQNNVRRFLRETTGTEVSFINTFSLLSIPGLHKYLEMILELRREFGYENQEELHIRPPDRNGFEHPPFIRKRRQRIWFDIPYLRMPDWMSAQIAAFYPELMDELDRCIKFMEDNKEDENYGKTFHGFKEYEIAKLKRDMAWIKQGKEQISDVDLHARKLASWMFWSQIDDRRKTDFITTFPELSNWFNDTYTVYQESVSHEKAKRKSDNEDKK